jgi:hypothetical protein
MTEPDDFSEDRTPRQIECLLEMLDVYRDALREIGNLFPDDGATGAGPGDSGAARGGAQEAAEDACDLAWPRIHPAERHRRQFAVKMAGADVDNHSG